MQRWTRPFSRLLQHAFYVKLSNMRKSLSVPLLLLLLFVQSTMLLQAAPPVYPLPQEPTWEITSPVANARLRGTTPIRGSAYLGGPSIFWKYMIYYAPLSHPQDWHQITYSEREMRDGHLGEWDTATVPDGTYNPGRTPDRGSPNLW